MKHQLTTASRICRLSKTAGKWTICGFILLILSNFGSNAQAETLIRLSPGGSKTLSPSRPIERVINHSEHVITTQHIEHNHTIKVTGVTEGDGIFEIVSRTRGHRESSRKYRVIVRGENRTSSSRAAKRHSAGDESGFQDWIRRSFKNLSARPLDDGILIEGRLSSLKEFQYLETFALNSDQMLIPGFDIPDEVLSEITHWLDRRLARSGLGSLRMARDGSSISLAGAGQEQPEAQDFIQKYKRILPGLVSTIAGGINLQTQVKVTMHFVESSRTDREERSQKISGAHFPIRASWTVGGFEQAPFQFYLRHLNEQIGAKVVDQPALVTRSGAAAKLHSGGDIAYSTATDLQETTTEFRSFGLSAVVRPVVLQNSDINLDLELEISEPSATGSVSQEAALSTRNVESKISLEDGMARLIARLHRQKKEFTRSSPPILGDIPFISWLVTSKTESTRATELWIFVSATSNLYQDFNVSDDEVKSTMGEHTDVHHH